MRIPHQTSRTPFFWANARRREKVSSSAGESCRAPSHFLPATLFCGLPNLIVRDTS